MMSQEAGTNGLPSESRRRPALTPVENRLVQLLTDLVAGLSRFFAAPGTSSESGIISLRVCRNGERPGMLEPEAPSLFPRNQDQDPKGGYSEEEDDGERRPDSEVAAQRLDKKGVAGRPR